VERQKTLSLPGGFESTHLSFSHPSGLMRNLGAIVGIWLGIVGDARQDRSTGSSIALQLVGDDPEWLLALPAQQSAKEPLGCTLIAARLQQNIDDITILIHGTPKILLLAVILTKSSSRYQVSPRRPCLLLRRLALCLSKTPCRAKWACARDRRL
jgi:hypothetical protein